MRSEIRTAFAVLATTAVLLGSATMALAAEGDDVVPEPAAATSTPSPSPSPTESSPPPGPTESSPTPEPTDSSPTPTPTDPSPTPTPAPSPTAAPVPTGAFTVTDAQVRWGINDESNNRAFAPGTFNFFSAGKIADPGRGNTQLTQAGWKQADGQVSIQKYLNGSWTSATWEGLRTDTDGKSIPGTNGPFSGHEVVIGGGTGTVDPTSGTASIQWNGSFTVLYYSGYSFFYVTDPKLTVTGGVGRLTATLSGFGSSMDDLTQWKPVAPVPNVVLADLGAVDLAKDLGFTATPAYKGVAVTVPGDAQVRSGDSWGSFPQSFIDYQTSSGTGSYWYSSGGAADAHKVAKPVTISYAAGSPVAVKAPAKAKKKSAKNDAPRNKAVAPPASVPAGLPAVTAPLTAPADAQVAGTTYAQTRPVSTVTGASAAPVGRTGAEGVWILGGVLLGAAALVTLTPLIYSATRTER
ncbi:hypothetical protein [Aeromicrobium fastidiosum]|uniref:Htaa domain-containing protein n=1 Tax=Aeromicrobium fastidiosum TaxID=52699 RepID=A0A641AHH0_9ACTN|nr:hypothetical protein [Aeromicrobium fastidiosum]KAA1372946.1 hypothetical protein ESP62_017770 [Aeromicrobium fastidiosum]MBP2390910.1 cell division septation protein DedD [Aeromicrobium fastidiosum]